VEQVTKEVMAKSPRLMERKRKFAREAMLDAAERLLMRSDPPDFSMRALCDEAGVSFTTPFNYFGSKNGIVQALALRIFEEIHRRYAGRPSSGDAVDRVFAMSRTGVEVWLERPSVNRFISASLMVSGGEHISEDFLARSCGLWNEALNGLDGLDDRCRQLASSCLALNCAIAFRGVMALWIGGEVSNAQFAPLVETQLATLLLALVPSERRSHLLTIIENAGKHRPKYPVAPAEMTQAPPHPSANPPRKRRRKRAAGKRRS
jgi:AcrR family transcriptional regulator